MTSQLDKILYTAKTHTTSGRDGRAVSDDGLLDVQLNPPKSLGGNGSATNPEQLFAAGYSACFLSAIKFVAGQKKIAVPADASIDATIDLGPIAQGFGLRVALSINLPGIERSVAEDLVHTAHQVCPYSNATRGNIDVALTVA